MPEKNQQSVGQCMICRKTVSKGQMTRHTKKCIEQNTKNDGQSITLFHLIIEGKYLPMYWLHVEIPGAMTLADLDSFLRDIWLECCGHLSCFTIDEQCYSVCPAEDMLFGPREKNMNKKIYNILRQGTKFQHEYDYGSTTDLKLRVVDIRKREVKKPEVTLLARNEPPELMCAKCGKPATQIRATGWGMDLNALYCNDCIGNDDEEEMFLPLVNSPRTGVCGYCGPESMGNQVLLQEENVLLDPEIEHQELIDERPGGETDINSWRRLYAAADQIKKLAPWQWMEETTIFGVQFPGTDEIGYVSVMGNIEEHYAVSVYLGDEALNKFWDIQNAPQTRENAERILELPQLMASFEDHDMVEQKDRGIIKQLGLKYRGKNGWPLFRSYRPGFYPWFLEQDEIGKLTIALEQTAGMAMRLEDEPGILEMKRNRDFLVRVPREDGNDMIWEDAVRKLPAPVPFTLTFKIDHKEMEALKGMPKDIRSAEVEFFLAPAGVAEPGKRPTFTYMLLAVETESFFILGTELLQATDGLHRMWEAIPAKLVSILNKAQFVPKEIRVSSPRLYQFLAPVHEDLGMEISFYENLPAIEDVKESMRDFMLNRR